MEQMQEQMKKFEDAVIDGPVWLALFAGFFLWLAWTSLRGEDGIRTNPFLVLIQGSVIRGASRTKTRRRQFWVIANYALGMPIFDHLQLDELARVSSALNQETFLFIAAPLNIEGATGSPVTPIAVF